MMRRPGIHKLQRARRGFALILVISVLALIAMYLLAAHGAIQGSSDLRRITNDRMTRAEQTGMAVALMSQAGAPESRQWKAPDDTAKTTLIAQRRAAAAGDAAWAELPGLTAKPGDAWLTLTFPQAPGTRRVQRYLINTQKQRAGAILLASADNEKKSAAAAGATLPGSATPTTTTTATATATATPSPTATASPSPAAAVAATTASTAATSATAGNGAR